MKKHDKKIIKNYLKRKLRFQKNTDTISTSDANIQLFGDVSLWHKLPVNIRIMAQKEWTSRLSYLRNLISTEARLPMPPIRMVPVGWWEPQTGGVIYGQVKPIPIEGCFQWAVIVPVSTLFVVDDDSMLRRILCHEFAHCFWYICKIIREMKGNEWKFKDIATETSVSQIIFEQVKKDKDELVNPTDWFGEWDAKNFLYESVEPLHKFTEKFAEYWINAGLPTELPDPTFKVDGEIGMEDEVVEHVASLIKVS